MCKTPSSANYSGKFNISQLQELPTPILWVKYPNVSEAMQTVIVHIIKERQFINNNLSLEDYFNDDKLFLALCYWLEEFQNSLSNSLKSSTFIDDMLALRMAYLRGVQPKNARKAKNNTIKKVAEYIKKNDKVGFLAFLRSRARSGTHTVYTSDDIETYSAEELYSPSTLDILIDEENEREEAELEALQALENLENMVDAKLNESQKIGLFDADELENDFVKAGNKYPKKVKKVIKNDDFSLFHGKEV